MGIRQIGDVDRITDTGSVRRLVIRAKREDV
jgi:hypothetical protein